jgi:DNA-binding beta-propeller fold protein YncE
MTHSLRRAFLICSAASLLVVALPSISSRAAGTARLASESSPVERQLWASRYQGPGKSDDQGGPIAVSPDGARVFVTGWSVGVTSRYDWVTIAYDASSGAPLWTKRFNGPANENDIPSSLGISPDGSTLFVTGWDRITPRDIDYATIAYDASTGAKAWMKRYDGPASLEDTPSSLDVSPDGTRVYVTGGSVHGEINLDYATIAYQASDGAQLWVMRYNGGGDDYDDPVAVETSPDGATVFVTGQSRGLDSYSDYATIAYDAITGAQRWVTRFNGSGDFFDDASALTVSPDGTRVYVTGNSTGISSLFDYATVAYDASTGAKVWVKRYEGPAKGLDIPSSIGVSPDGTKVFVTGTSDRLSSLGDYFTIAYDAASGAWLWGKTYDGQRSNDGAAALAVTSDGTQVVVTGSSRDATGDLDYATVGYNAATGHQVWAKRYDSKGSDDDSAAAIAVSPDGDSVFVTGASLRSGFTDYDFATIAYVMS